MKKNYNRLIERYYDKLWNENDKSYIDILFVDDISFQGSLGIKVKGKKEFAEYMDTILSAFPDLYHGIEQVVIENDKAAVRAVYVGTHKGKLHDFEPTGKRISYDGATFFTFEDDKISDIWVLGDLNSLYKQLR